MSVILETTIGDIVVDLFIDERPKAALNFLKLCKLKYYNYCLFFSIQRNFIAQTGDPAGTGRGGSSIYEHMYGAQARYFEMELKPRIKHSRRGLISFANNNNNMHGSQFFITLADNLDFLDGKHTVFGEVAEGLDVLEKLNETICDDECKPYQDVRVNHTIVLHDPFDDPKGIAFPDRSPEPTKQQLESGRIGADEDLDDQAGKSKEEIEKLIEEKELRIGTHILETVGDIPDADLKPPENVLFVCKLNPVTSAEDLEIIFSRFGPILSCEIIHDQKTGDSLQYGFIEFEKVEDCEKAYFKMDNVLIDDRRIHVDFCQSVAKMKWKKSGLAAKYGMMRDQHQKEELTLKKTRREDRYDMVFENPNAQYRSQLLEETLKNEKKDRGKAKRNKRKSKRHETETDTSGSDSSEVSDSDSFSSADKRDGRRDAGSRPKGGSQTSSRKAIDHKYSAKTDYRSSDHRKKEHKRRKRKETP